MSDPPETSDNNDGETVMDAVRDELDDEGHDWELKGGASAQYTSDRSVSGLSLWQCRDCHVSASRHITQKQCGAMNAVLDPPDVEVKCPPEKETE